MRALFATGLLIIVLTSLAPLSSNGTRTARMLTNPTTTKSTDSQAKQSGPISFHTILWTEYGTGQRGVTEINDATFWSNYWSTPTPPPVNFSSRTVLVAAAGQEGSGGYLTNITRVTIQTDSVLVQIIIITPGKNCFTTTVITDPIHIVDIPKTTIPAIAEITQVQAPACPF